MPDQSPILSLPLIMPAQAQKHVTHNEALRLLDVMVQLAVLNRTLNAAPALPAIGDRHIVAAGAVGAWAGQVGKIAVYTSTGWQFFTPLAGWQAHVLAEGVTVNYTGLVWGLPTPATSSPIFGVNTTADTTNRLAVQSAASLFTNAGAGHQMKVNKAALGDTASLLFQTGFSGRAEMGLAGSDDFSVKVSANGLAFNTALTAAAASGIVSLPQGISSAGFTLRDGTDSTKAAAFSISGISTGTTRTYSLPNTTSEIAVLAGSQTFTGAKTFSGGFTSNAAAVLFNHAGAGVEATVNKAAVGDSATVVLKTGFSTRTQFGLIGSDATALRVSADGTAFSDVFSADPATGRMTLANPAILGGQATDPASPANGMIWHNSTSGEIKVRAGGISQVIGATGGGISDGDKGEVTVTGSGTVWTIDAGAVTLAKMAPVATASIFGRTTAGTGTPEALTAVQARAVLNVASGATANSADAVLLDRANHTGAQVSTTISDFIEAAQDAIGAMVNPTLIYTDATPSLARAALTGDVTAPVGSNATTIANDAVTNAKLANMNAATIKGNNTGVAGDPLDLTGTQTTAMLDTVTPALKGLAPASGGGTTNFLRADGTWAAPAGGGGGVTDGDKGDISVSGTGTVWTIDPAAVTLAKQADVASARLMGRVTAGAGVQEALTGTQATTLLDPFTSGLKGLVPASGGGTTTFLRADGTFAAPSAGSGAPGGATGKVQFNNAAAFDGAANVEIDTGNLKLLAAADPAAPASGLVVYGRSVAGRMLPKVMGPSGSDAVLQAGLHGSSVFLLTPSNGTGAPVVIGGQLTTATTISHVQTFASANAWQATRRTRFTTAATAGSASGARTSYGQWFLGNAAGFGGFWFRAQFGTSINLAGGQKFCGLAFASTGIAGDPSGLLNMCGMGYDAADSSAGNWQFMRNDGSGVATKVDLGAGAARNANDGYDLMMHVRPNSAELFVRIVNLQTKAVVLDTSYTTDIPAVNTALTFKCEVRNGLVAAADSIELAKAYVESDY